MAHFVDDNMDKAEADYVTRELIRFADQFTEPRNYREFGLALRDDEGNVVGGIMGNAVWDWLQISALWVSENLRGKGFGHQLLERAEQWASAQGCRFSRLSTFEFEAKGFYEAHGYEIYAKTDDFPAGHTQYHLAKELPDR